MTPREVRVLYIIWVALLISAVWYGVIGYLVGPKDPPTDSTTLMVQVLGMFALFNVGTSYVIRPMMAPAVAFQPYMIIRWAMCETPALFGLVLRFLGASNELMGGFIAAGIVALLISAPTDAEHDTYESYRKKS